MVFLGSGKGSENGVRSPAVAGTFYPNNRQQLRHAVEAELVAATPPALPSNPRILIAPHAGYVYSAATAAHAFKSISDPEKIHTVILMGCPHREAVHGAAIWGKGEFLTPLGKVTIDEAMAARLTRVKGAEFSESPHLEEHSLEVELPFIQVVAPSAKIVPILVAPPSIAFMENFAAAIASELKKPGILLVVSTDMSHYPTSEQEARLIDTAMLDALKMVDVTVLLKRSRAIMAEKHKNVVCTLCGEEAVATALLAARQLGLTHAVVLHYSNSAQRNPSDHVVGYGAVAFCHANDGAPNAADAQAKKPVAQPGDVAATQSKPTAIEKIPFINDPARRELTLLACAALKAALEGADFNPPAVKEPDCCKRAGCFVTLKNHGELRGCLGRFDAGGLPLYELVPVMAKSSATNDYRFASDPPSLKELPELSIDISVLTPMQRLLDWREIRLGVDGVVISRGGRSGVFLPQVATETGWGLEEFLSHLCRDKAGLPADAYKDMNTKIEIFQAEVFGTEDK